jgi:hypothetical protein
MALLPGFINRILRPQSLTCRGESEGRIGRQGVVDHTELATGTDERNRALRQSKGVKGNVWVKVHS